MRIALGIEYNGADFYGWQRQKEVTSVQQHLETALSRIADTPIEIQCAGRTDAGVHATAQIVHFDTPIERDMKAWSLGMNALLPDSIAVKWVKPVTDAFHARFSATARRYRYVIYNHALRPAVLVKGVTHFYHDLDEEKMHRAAQCLVGEQDFTAFRASHCQSKSPYRKMTHIRVYREQQYVIVDVQANAFLHHMVRNIVGSLMEIGCGNQNEDWMAQLLHQKDRKLAAATAKPNGLYLVRVIYPEEFEIPELVLGPLFLPERDF